MYIFIFITFVLAEECTEIITIPEGTKVIGEGAYENCKTLKTLELPNTLETISERAFSGCSNLEGPLIIPKLHQFN